MLMWRQEYRKKVEKMENNGYGDHISSNYCGSCSLFKTAAEQYINGDFVLRVIDLNDNIKKDPEGRFMHSANPMAVGVRCMYNEGKIVENYSDKPPICQQK